MSIMTTMSMMCSHSSGMSSVRQHGNFYILALDIPHADETDMGAYTVVPTDAKDKAFVSFTFNVASPGEDGAGVDEV